jgi:hypothetical protein
VLFVLYHDLYSVLQHEITSCSTRCKCCDVLTYMRGVDCSLSHQCVLIQIVGTGSTYVNTQMLVRPGECLLAPDCIRELMRKEIAVTTAAPRALCRETSHVG